jgi:two-component system response regulator YesN
MEQAGELLRTTSRKVIDIGTSVGYANYSYFCQSFREYFGRSPEKYRQEESL